jgi:rhodanese-related sulfurtransferase
VQDAFNLVEANKGNQKFVVIDVRTAPEFGVNHIEGAINLDFLFPDFADNLKTADKNFAYLLYGCRDTDDRSGKARGLMVQQGFMNVSNMKEGMDEWLKAGYSVIKPSLDKPDSRAISPQEMFHAINCNSGNPDTMLIDVRTPAEFATMYIAGATNIDYNASDWQQKAEALDKSKTYLIVCLSGMRSEAARKSMEGMGFYSLYSMVGGITAWQAAGYPVVK